MLYQFTYRCLKDLKKKVTKSHHLIMRDFLHCLDDLSTIDDDMTLHGPSADCIVVVSYINNMTFDLFLSIEHDI